MTNPPKPADRRGDHERIAAVLARASDEELLELLSDPRFAEVGHAAVQLPDASGMVFVKLVPLTELELAAENRGSTANMFGLPAYYQYRIGGCGFGAWRELEIHRLTNEWVLSGQCAAFPLLHHWRILPRVPTGYDDRRTVEHWGDCPAIHERTAAMNDATCSAALFLEYFPRTLGQWLGDELRTAADPATLMAEVEDKLEQRLAFLHAQGLIHLDAHFENILTDGRELYLADFGLSMSRHFALSPDELAFFELHENFDSCTVVTASAHAVVTHYEARTDWRQPLREMVAGEHRDFDAAPEELRRFLLARAPLALAIGEFYGRLLADLDTVYPAPAFAKLLPAPAP